MRILVADDDAVFRETLSVLLTESGHEVLAAANGQEAWQILEADDAPAVALLDWMMPGTEGIDLCRKVRALPRGERTYLILLSARGASDEIVAGLDSGADDYLTKPIDLPELHARLRVGLRVVALQRRLAHQVQDLYEALSHVKQLRGLLPICSYCKKIRDDQNYWQQVESYISAHTDAEFSHGICPGCYEAVVKPEVQKLIAEAHR